MLIKNFLNKRLLTVVLCLALLLCALVPLTLLADDVTGIDDGFVSVEDFGATANDNKDDYQAFKSALATGKNVYVPDGRFVVSDTIVVEDASVFGLTSGVTFIRGNFDDKSKPIMIIKGKSNVSDIAFIYQNTDIAADEKQGERVGIQIGDNARGLEAGSVLSNLHFNYVGTAIYCPKDSSCNGVLFDTIEIAQLCYRGVDMQCENRKGNTYSNIYINDGNYYKLVNAGFALEGSEYSPVLNQINIEHSVALYGLILRNVKNFNISSIHFEGWTISQNDMGFVYAENSSGYFGNLTHILNFIRCYNTSLIRMGDSQNGDVIKIGNINLRGVNQPHDTLIAIREDLMADLGGLENRGLKTPQSKTFVVFERDKNAKGDYQIAYENYAFYSYHSNEFDFWNSLPTRGSFKLSKVGGAAE